MAMGASEAPGFVRCECRCAGCARARRYGFVALGAIARTAPVAAECVLDESAGLPVAPAGAGTELVVVVELAPLGCGALVPRDAWVTYCGVRPFHHAVKPENQPCAARGCPFPSYAGVIAGYPSTEPGRRNSSLSTLPSVRIC